MKAMAVYCMSGYLRHTQRDPALTLTITQRSLSIEETPGLIQSQFPIQTGDLHSSPCGDSKQQALPSRRYHMQPQMSTYACVSVCVSLHTCLYKYLHMFV